MTTMNIVLDASQNEFWEYHHKTNASKVIIATDVFYYYYDYADYSSRRLQIL